MSQEGQRKKMTEKSSDFLIGLKFTRNFSFFVSDFLVRIFC